MAKINIISALNIDGLTTTERDEILDWTAGDMIWNETVLTFQQYNGFEWQDLNGINNNNQCKLNHAIALNG